MELKFNQQLSLEAIDHHGVSRSMIIETYPPSRRGFPNKDTTFGNIWTSWRSK